MGAELADEHGRFALTLPSLTTLRGCRALTPRMEPALRLPYAKSNSPVTYMYEYTYNETTRQV